MKFFTRVHQTSVISLGDKPKRNSIEYRQTSARIKDSLLASEALNVPGLVPENVKQNLSVVVARQFYSTYKPNKERIVLDVFTLDGTDIPLGDYQFGKVHLENEEIIEPNPRLLSSAGRVMTYQKLVDGTFVMVNLYHNPSVSKPPFDINSFARASRH